MRIGTYFSLIKFAHTLFALPFALIGYAWGVWGVDSGEDQAWFDGWILVKVLLCMVFARNAAMGFNRVVDRQFDAKNRRTAGREIPTGTISVRAGKWFVAINALAFIAATASINTLVFILAPVALGVILGYSYTKRFTPLCHLVLAFGLSIAPCGAYIAVAGNLGDEMILPGLISGVVLTWVSGFDIIYSLQDETFDREQRLHSVPAWLGVRRAIVVSMGLHAVSVLTVGMVGVLFFRDSVLYWLGSAIFTGMLIYQHGLVRAGDLSKIGPAFTTVNGVTSVAYAIFVILAIVF